MNGLPSLVSPSAKSGQPTKIRVCLHKLPCLWCTLVNQVHQIWVCPTHPPIGSSPDGEDVWSGSSPIDQEGPQIPFPAQLWVDTNDSSNGNSVKTLTCQSLTTQVLPWIPAIWIPVTLMRAHQSSPDLDHHQSGEHQNSSLEQVWMKMETLLDNTPWTPVICHGVIWIPLICRGVIWILMTLMRTCQRNTQSLGVLLEPVIQSRGYRGADQQC